MYRNILRIVFFLLLPFGAMACTRKPTAVPTSSVSYETAMKAVEELTKVTEEQGKLIEKAIQNDEDTLVMIKEMKEALDQIEKFRAQNPEIHRRLTENSTERLRFECVGHVQGVGQADLFKLGGRTLFCTQPGVPRPADGSVCFNVPGTKFWDCGTGQVLYECTYCGCATPTNTPEAQKSATPTNTPEAQKSATPTNTPEAQKSATPTNTPEAQKSATPTNTPEAQKSATPTPKPVPTNGPTPEGTVCTPEPVNCDEVIDFNYEPELDDPVDFGTIVEKKFGAGQRTSFGGKGADIREDVGYCQVHVANMYHLVEDYVTGKSAGTDAEGNCIVAYARGTVDFQEIHYKGSHGVGFHINIPEAGFGANEGIAQMRVSLEALKDKKGNYVCHKPGDNSRPGTKEIKFIELGLRNK